MTPTMTSPAMNATNIAITNMNMIVSICHIQKKDMADGLGKMPQALSKMLHSGYSWSFKDMCAAADYLGVSLDDLVNPNLTPAAVFEKRNGSDTNKPRGGGVTGPRYFVLPVVAGSGFEPETSGL